MKVQEIVNELNLEVITCNQLLDREVSDGCVGDLLSVVMGKATKDCVWVTVQSHINIIAVGMLVEVSCIIVSEGFSIDNDAISKAQEEDVILLSSKESNYKIAAKLSALDI